jgi:hypothetical protein
MNSRCFLSARAIFPLAAILLGSACNLSLNGGTTLRPQITVITSALGTEPQESPTTSPILELTPTPSQTLTPTLTSTATVEPVTMTAGQNLSCVKGPQWILYERVASIAEGETVTLLAKAGPDWEEYYYVRKSDGTECWAFGGSSTKSGDLSTLPVREAPPLPTVTYIIENQTALPVYFVFIREKGSTDWGVNRLGGGTIASGASFSLAITAGYYDVAIADQFGDDFYRKSGWPIGSDPAYHHTVLDNQVDFFVQNDFAFDLCKVYFKIQGGTMTLMHSDADGPIVPGARAQFHIPVGIYDIRVVRCSVPVSYDKSLVIGPKSTGTYVP